MDMMEEKITPNFRRREFRCNGAHCCGGSAPIQLLLVKGVQEFRYLVNRNVFINSGFRCITHNRSIGSSDESKHPLGMAADIKKVVGFSIVDMAKIAEGIEQFSMGGIGLYNWGIHVDVFDSLGPRRWDKRTHE